MQHFRIDNSLWISYSTYMKAYLNASEIAKILKVDRTTVTRGAQKGKFKGAVRIEKSHQWRIPLTSVEGLMKQNA
jgi:DNA-binding transcriptional regulator LsrR (DeoR family)